MSGKGEQHELLDSQGQALGTVWESGHFEGHGVQGRVRKTPAGWSVFVDKEPSGTIDRQGRHTAAPLRLEGGRILDEDGREVLRVDDERFAAAALALVGALPADRWTSAAPAVRGPSPLVFGAVLLVLVLVGLAAVFLLVS